MSSVSQDERNPPSQVNTLATRIALSAILAAMAIGGNYALALVPNVELSSVMVFLSGFLFGASIGAFVGLISMTVYQLWNPWGAFIPPIGLAVITSTIFIGIVGGILGRKLTLNTKKPSGWIIWPAVFGVLTTIFFDLVTTFAYCLTFGIPYMIALIMGLPFMIIHILSNGILFGLLILPLSRVARQLNIGQEQFRAILVANTKDRGNLTT